MTRELGASSRVDARGLAIDAPSAARLDAILAAGAALFNEQGFNRTVTDDVASRAGVTKRTLYRYVGSKQALLFAVCSQLHRRLEAISELPTAKSASLQLHELILNATQAMLDLRQVVLVYLAERKHLTVDQEEFLARCESEFVSKISEALRWGSACGEMRKCDAEVVARGVFGSLAHSSRWYRPGGALQPEALARLVSSLWIDGLFGIEPSHDLGDAPLGGAASDVVGDVDLGEPNDAQEKILDVATQMFADLGFDATSTRSLADAANITKGSLHYYIERKESLLLRIHFRVMAASMRAMDEVTQQNLPPRVAIAEIIRLHLQNVSSYHSAIVVFNEESKALGSDGMEQIVQSRIKYARSLEETIVQALAHEDMKLPGQQVRIVTLMLLAMLNSAYRWFGQDDEATVRAVSDELTALFLQGVTLSGDSTF